MKEIQLELGFTDEEMLITWDSTHARLSVEYTDDIQGVMEAQRIFRKKHNPSFLEFCKSEKKMVVDNGMSIDYPHLKWNVVWDHKRTGNIPRIHNNKEHPKSCDAIFDGYLDECVEMVVFDTTSN